MPYYRKWMNLFPDVRTLAEADRRVILREWEGLGYYSRAENIHKAAGLIMTRFSGRLPDRKEELLDLPGIGPYTAAAVLSLAFGRKEIVFDANVRRILQRYSADPVWSRGLQEAWEKRIRPLLDKKTAASFNEALMQLGQIICRNRNPRCCECPLSGGCRAFIRSEQHSYPEKRKGQVTEKTGEILCLFRENTLYLVRRTEGIGRGLWTFPYVRDIDLPGSGNITLLPERTHAYTRFKEILKPKLMDGSFLDPGNLPGEGDWIETDRLDMYPMPPVYRKIAGDAVAEISGKYRDSHSNKS
jgi:A/G-specific adenine glycosylase